MKHLSTFVAQKASGLKSLFNIRLLLLAAIVISVAVASPGCKAAKEKKRMEQERVEAEARLRERITQTTKELEDILNNPNLTVEEKENLLADIKSRNINDPNVNSLIAKLEAEIKNEKAKKLEENKKVVLSAQDVMLQAFSKIAAAPSMDEANKTIATALQGCVSESIPVLIIIAEDGGVKDYDKPTTIKEYLNYIKDQKKFENKVEELVVDDNGKIKRIILRK